MSLAVEFFVDLSLAVEIFVDLGLAVEFFVDLGLVVEFFVDLSLVVIIRKLTAFTSVLPDTRVAVPHPDGIGIAHNCPVAVVAGIVGRVQRLVIGVPPNRTLADLLGQRGVVFGVVHALAGAGCCIAHGPAAGLFCTGRSGLGVGRGCLDGLDVLIRVLNGVLIFLHDSSTISRSIRAGSCLAHKVCQRLPLAVRQGRQVPNFAYLIAVHNTAIRHLGRYVQFFGVAHVLQPVGCRYQQRAARAFALGKQHFCSDIAELDGKRLDFTLIERAPGVAEGAVLQHILVGAEVVEHIGVDALHLIGGHNIGLGLQLLDVRVGVGEQQNAAALALQVFPAESLTLFFQILIAGEVVHLGGKAECRTVFDGLGNALVLQVYQIHRGRQRVVVLAENIALVLEFRHNAAPRHFNGGGLAAAECIAQPGRGPILHDFTAGRQHGEHANGLTKLIDDRHNKGGVLHLQNCAKPVQELSPGLPLIRPLPEPGLQFRVCGSLHGDAQLAGVGGRGVDRGAHDLALIQLAAPGQKAGRVAVQCRPESRREALGGYLPEN